MDAEERKKWTGKLNKEAAERRQALKKLKKEQQKALIRETREQMRKRMDRPREKEIARLMGKRAEGTLATSLRARAHHKRHPSAVQGVLSREK
jgi:predicted aminopeptidase